MRLMSIKTAVLAAAASAALFAPAAQAGHRHHHYGYYGHPHVVHYTYRPVYVQRVYQRCAKYGWVWIKGEKCWACVKYW